MQAFVLLFLVLWIRNGSALTVDASQAAGSPGAYIIDQECRTAAAALLKDPTCSTAIGESCGFFPVVLLQWQLLCMSGIVKDPDAALKPEFRHDVRADWAAVVPGARSYLDLWRQKSSVRAVKKTAAAELGPLAKALLANEATHLHILELASSRLVDGAFKTAVQRLALAAGLPKSVVMHTIPPSTDVRKQDAAQAAQLELLELPMTEEHPLLASAHPTWSTVLLKVNEEGATGDEGEPALYSFKAPSGSAGVVDVKASTGWLDRVRQAPSKDVSETRYHKFSTVWNEESAQSVMVDKSEVGFDGFYAGPSQAYETAHEEQETTAGGLYLDFYHRESWQFDGTALMALDVPLQKGFRDALTAFAKAGKPENIQSEIYDKFGNYVIVGWRRSSRLAGHAVFKGLNAEQQIDLAAALRSASKPGTVTDAGAAVSLLLGQEAWRKQSTLVGYLTAESDCEAQLCQLPKTTQEVTADKFKAVQDALEACAAQAGAPSAECGDRTVVVLAPLVRIPAVAAILGNVAPAAPGVPDVSKLLSGAQVHVALQKLYASATYLETLAWPLHDVNPVYQSATNLVEEDITKATIANLASCDNGGNCAAMLQAFDGVHDSLRQLAAVWSKSGDMTVVVARARELRKEVAKLETVTKPTLPAKGQVKLQGDITRIQAVISALEDTVRPSINTKLMMWEGVAQSGELLFDHRCPISTQPDQFHLRLFETQHHPLSLKVDPGMLVTLKRENFKLNDVGFPQLFVAAPTPDKAFAINDLSEDLTFDDSHAANLAVVERIMGMPVARKLEVFRSLRDNLKALTAFYAHYGSAIHVKNPFSGEDLGCWTAKGIYPSAPIVLTECNGGVFQRFSHLPGGQIGVSFTHSSDRSQTEMCVRIHPEASDSWMMEGGRLELFPCNAEATQPAGLLYQFYRDTKDRLRPGSATERCISAENQQLLLLMPCDDNVVPVHQQRMVFEDEFIPKGQPIAVLEPDNNHLFIGTWRTADLCPANTFIYSVQGEMETDLGKQVDNAGMLSVRFNCREADGSPVGASGLKKKKMPAPTLLPYGFEFPTPEHIKKVVLSPVECADKALMVGVDQFAQPEQDPEEDDTAVNEIMMSCDQAKDPVQLGTNLNFASAAWLQHLLRCPPASALCGLQVKVLDEQEGVGFEGRADDYGMTGSRWFCCLI